MSSKNFTVLVAVDGSEPSMRAVECAVNLIKKENTPRLILLNVLNVDTGKRVSSSFVAAPTYGLKEYEKHKKATFDWMEAIRKKCEKEPVQVETKVLEEGSPVTESIINYAEKENVDLIVVGTRGNSGFKKLLLGSVASGVITHAHCSVLVAR